MLWGPSAASPGAEAESKASKPAAATAIDPALLEVQSQRIAVMAKVKDCALAIFVPTGQGGGSGVVITPDGYALSNFHVVHECGPAMKCGMADGRLYDAVLVGIDPTGDVALIKLLGRSDFPHAELGDSDRVRVGDWVFAMGNPFLLATDLQPTVTHGIISGVHRYQYPSGTILEYADCLQTDASINPGNSGGPLFDALGRLIGINGRGSFEKRGRVAVGAGYAISINQIKNFLGDLQSGRVVDHATLGAVFAFDSDGRVAVSDIVETSDAYRRGLRMDDELVSFGGRPVSTPNGFKNVLGIYPKGWRVPLSYRREGKRYDIYVRLAGVHQEGELDKMIDEKPVIPMPIPTEKKPDEPSKKPARPKEGEAPKEGRQPAPIPVPIPIPGHLGPSPQALPMPEAVKKLFETKRGYANYYFNKLQRTRIWDAWTAKGNFAGPDGPWSLTGPLPGGGDFRFVLGNDDCLLKLPAEEIKWTAGTQLGASLLPQASGGLLPTLYLWRRLAVLGPGKFGEVSYLGKAPLAGRDALFDALLGVYGGVQCRCYFDPAQGTLAALEMYPDAEADPCEVYFSDYREFEGRLMPSRMEVRFGDEIFGQFKFSEIKLEKETKP
jgi:S1-C subfamily serine protease